MHPSIPIPFIFGDSRNPTVSVVVRFKDWGGMIQCLIQRLGGMIQCLPIHLDLDSDHLVKSFFFQFL